jgi:tRNA-specific 2-thiouridylase
MAKDQSYVLHMLGQDVLGRLLLPVGTMTKAAVRQRAGELGLRTADKPDSQDVCFISGSGGREAFLGERIPLRPGTVVDRDGAVIGSVPAVELVTVGQRRGLGTVGPVAGTPLAERSYAVAVDLPSATVTVGSLAELLVDEVVVEGWTWTSDPVAVGTAVSVQASAHGSAVAGNWFGDRIRFDAPVRVVAPGQSVVAYLDDRVVGGGTAAR